MCLFRQTSRRTFLRQSHQTRYESILCCNPWPHTHQPSLAIYAAYNGTAQTNAVLVSGLSGQTIKTAVAIARNDYAFVVNGGTVGSDTSVLVAEADEFFIGAAANSAILNGCMRKIAYYPTRLTNAELQGLTTV